ncbi:single-stranded DNA-binding protein [Streptomyces sp. NPDC001812]|jgi:single-strand DNA-binding protein|uniref:Single-stranded DNA-binding protein n=1 Tax=Streptomyces cathayae TaxID=3031124 RepID=A0ABY8K9Z9_9ACTN|nr:single-stranded DNA-binding protein [Streptomyces sp. HUAS 5]WGD44493.1 single-stranded DNA-binding protein [Streptomyces sp. HUAS 5]
MVGETVVTVVGNLTDDPEIRTTPSGDAVTHFTVASTPRTFDRQSNEWRDADTLFLRCSAWRQTAEHVAQSLARGTRVIVQGRLHQRTYETREGEKRTVIELEALEIGPSLRYAAATVSRTPRVGVPDGTLFDTVPPAPNDAPGAPDGDESASREHHSPTFPF